MTLYFKVEKENLTINNILKQNLGISSRLFSKLINNHLVSVNNIPCDTRNTVHIGDIISIDIPNYTITLEVSDEELEKRKQTMPILKKDHLTGYLKRYAKLVSSADKGAIINR